MNANSLRYATLIFIGILFFQKGDCQPYFDAAALTGWYVPQGEKNEKPSETHLLAAVSVPVNLNKNDKLVVSPWYDHRYLRYSEKSKSLLLRETGFPLTFLHTNNDSSWSFTATIIERANSSDFRFEGDVFQLGGAFINTIRLRPNFKIKFGLYYNKEFFGHYFIPLAGIDWKINDHLNLFGIIPNYLKLENKLNKNLYFGLLYRSITSSFRNHGEAGYYKLEDNHLGIYADVYLTKNIVLMADAGRTFFRQLTNKTGTDFPGFEKDGFIFKAGMFYRVRFD